MDLRQDFVERTFVLFLAASVLSPTHHSPRYGRDVPGERSNPMALPNPQRTPGRPLANLLPPPWELGSGWQSSSSASSDRSPGQSRICT